jgi:hypothetical protein
LDPEWIDEDCKHIKMEAAVREISSSLHSRIYASHAIHVPSQIIKRISMFMTKPITPVHSLPYIPLLPDLYHLIILFGKNSSISSR